jgi:hypothetical protein
MKRLKKSACKCGADAVIVTSVDREPASFDTFGHSGAKGIGIRYTDSGNTTSKTPTSTPTTPTK